MGLEEKKKLIRHSPTSLTPSHWRYLLPPPPPPPSSPHADGLTRSESLQQMVRCESAAEWVEIGTGISLNISGVPEYNEDISEHVELHIKLVTRIIRNDKEDPLTGMPAPAPHPSVPEADGWMWMRFTHEQGRKEKTIFPPLLCSCYPLTKHFSMMSCNTFEFEDWGNTLCFSLQTPLCQECLTAQSRARTCRLVAV